MTDRRAFLQSLGAAVITTTGMTAGLLGATRARRERLAVIGIQLYTLRHEMAQDFEGTLARVAGIGYKEVEFAGYFDRTPGAVRRALDLNGLSAPAAHVPIEALRDDWNHMLEAAQETGHRYVIVAWIPANRRRAIDDYRRLAELFNRAGERAREVGLHFAYHNHDFEFARLDGQIPYDVLLAETDPREVLVEMDLFWIMKGGGDPFRYFARYPGRIHMVHVKDMNNQGQMVDVGDGEIEFARIFAKREQAGIKHYFVEHDNPPSAFDTARRSYDYLKRLEF